MSFVCHHCGNMTSGTGGCLCTSSFAPQYPSPPIDVRAQQMGVPTYIIQIMDRLDRIEKKMDQAAAQAARGGK